ncbi:hypothetical protein JB92DRAFT_3147614 [Gautieria morchelliformis]|nr:hypothetical protein JB92DRAFT_3147614 [Gautieria morchelliformis]
MPRRSKAAQNRAQNLLKQTKFCKTTVAEVPDKELTWNTLPALDDDDSDGEQAAGDDEIIVKLQVLESEGLVEWDDEDMEDDEEEAAAEIQDDTALLLFIKTLQDAHAAAAAAEIEKEAIRAT